MFSCEFSLFLCHIVKLSISNLVDKDIKFKDGMNPEAMG